MSWTALADDDPLRPRVLAAVAELADGLASEPLDGPPGLADGLAGVALFFGHLAHALPAFAHHAATADRLLETAAESLDGSLEGMSFFHGFPGIAWTADHLRGLRGEPDLELNADIDDVIVEHLGRGTIIPFDLTVGLVGLGVYALERRGAASAQRCLEAVIDRLAEQARPEPEGIAFWTQPAWLADERVARFPGGCWNLGLAHGNPGVLAFLAAAAARSRRAGELAPRLATWLLSRRRDGGFAAREAPGVAPDPARTGWCFGDPGVALALAHAGHLDDAHAIARRAMARPVELTGVTEPRFCHGAIGLAHLAARLAAATGDGELRAASRAWLTRALDDALPAERGLLLGRAGLGLGLLAAIVDADPGWDRALLISTPRCS